MMIVFQLHVSNSFESFVSLSNWGIAKLVDGGRFLFDSVSTDCFVAFSSTTLAYIGGSRSGLAGIFRNSRELLNLCWLQGLYVRGEMYKSHILRQFKNECSENVLREEWDLKRTQ